MLDELNSSCMIAKISKSDHCLRMKECYEIDIEYKISYEFNKRLFMSFGMIDSSSAFLSFMNHVSSAFIDKTIVVYFDGIH